jgi:hypothetical protein
MKQCPQCRQNYPDDTIFCLSDGTMLIFINHSPEEVTVVNPLSQEEVTVFKPRREEITVVRPAQTVQNSASPVQSGVSPIFAYLSIGLLLLLIGGGVIALAVFVISRISVGGNTNTEVAKVTNTDNGQNKIFEQQANLRQQQEQIEKERQRLANERQKLDEEKDKPLSTPVATPNSVATPMVVTPPPPLPTPPPRVNYPPQPMGRIRFGRGRTAESISGKVYTQRSFVLEARSGQYLSASISGGGCVTFSGGATSTAFSTIRGDNRLTLINNCNTEAGFTMTVSIR